MTYCVIVVVNNVDPFYRSVTYISGVTIAKLCAPATRDNVYQIQ